ncbi:TPA: hypothetical protein N0F65_004154, partial [Lagenidium giganteum]
EDYHGNVDSELFENRFYELCETLHNRYGSCRIHMDGAKYHKRNIHKAPDASSRKDEMRKKEAPLYATHIIAQGFNHEVLFTPPYRPKLQPIELIWGSVKQPISQESPTDMNDLHAKVWAGLRAQGSCS